MKKIIIFTVIVFCIAGCTQKNNGINDNHVNDTEHVNDAEDVKDSEDVKETTESAGNNVQHRDSDFEKSGVDNGEILYNSYKNLRYGFSVDIPDFLNGGQSDNGDGITYQSNDNTVSVVAYGSHSPKVFYENPTIQSAYDDEVATRGCTPSYKANGDNWFVISWEDGENIKYERYILNTDGTENVLLMTYPKNKAKEMDEIVTKISLSFKSGSGYDSECEN